MDTLYKYDVYFECPDLDNEKRKRIETYFQVRRKSGGGECGPLEVFKGNVYRIAFKVQQGESQKTCPIIYRVGGHHYISSYVLGVKCESKRPRFNVSSERRCSRRDRVPVSIPGHWGSYRGQRDEHPLLALQHRCQHQLVSHPEMDQTSPRLASKETTSARQVAMVLAIHHQWSSKGDLLHHLKESSSARKHDKADIVGHLQGKPEETQLPTVKLEESETGSLDKFKNRMMDIPSSRNEETQYGALSDQPLIQHWDLRKKDMGPAARVQEGKTGQHYLLPGGLCVLVRHGDITKEHADALVNAANENLNHNGGVAAALSRAGGSKVQQESTALVREHGPFATGKVVMTTGGNLQCKRLIHIVGPVQGRVNGFERPLLERSVGAALKLADDCQYQSIVMPCISSGIFQVPISVCAEAIVTAVEHFERENHYLKTITLIDNRKEVVRALQAACDRIFSSAITQHWHQHHLTRKDMGPTAREGGNTSPGASAPGPWPNSGANPVNIQVENMEGLIENQEVDAIVSPMKDHDPRSTGLGKRLSKLIGRKLDDAFLRREKQWKLPVEVNVEGLPELLCRKVFFVNLLPWDEQDSKAAVQALPPQQTLVVHSNPAPRANCNYFSTGPGLLKCKLILHSNCVTDSQKIRDFLRHMLKMCETNHHSSISFPALGTGTPGINHSVACNAMLDGVEAAVKSKTPDFLTLVRIVVMHSNVYKDFKYDLSFRQKPMEDKSL
ncbi:unnamed protein product [Merluccius merluccius]